MCHREAFIEACGGLGLGGARRQRGAEAAAEAKAETGAKAALRQRRA